MQDGKTEIANTIIEEYYDKDLGDYLQALLFINNSDIIGLNKMFSNGFDINKKPARDYKNLTFFYDIDSEFDTVRIPSLLHYAALHEKADMFKFLYSKGAVLDNYKVFKEQISFEYELSSSSEIVSFLISKNVYINNYNFIKNANESDMINLLKMLSAKNGTLSNAKLLSQTAEHNDLEMLTFLLKKGLNPNDYYYFRNDDEAVLIDPLVTAVEINFIEAIELLFDHGRKKNTVLSSFALSLAEINQNEQALELMQSYGVAKKDIIIPVGFVTYGIGTHADPPVSDNDLIIMREWLDINLVPSNKK
jgi:hypothetical protein